MDVDTLIEVSYISDLNHIGVRGQKILNYAQTVY